MLQILLSFPEVTITMYFESQEHLDSWKTINKRLLPYVMEFK
jgi:hypothetical protein